MLTLDNLQVSKGAKKNTKRRGRGNASGRGNYSGRGMKGQKSRSGGKSGLKRLGMRNMLLQLPKSRGFNRASNKAQIVNVSEIESKFKSGDIINPKELLKKGLIVSNTNGVKILASGKITKKFTISAHQFSKSAKDLIEKAGGSIIVLERKNKKVVKISKKKASLIEAQKK